MGKVIPINRTADYNEDALGVCPACGAATVEQIWVPDSVHKGIEVNLREFNRRQCRSCNEIWGGLYRKKLKR